MKGECIRKELKMEMCYDGALVMPKQFAVVAEDEMEYVEGGDDWSGKRLLRNLAGFCTIACTVGYILDKQCPDWWAAASWGFTYACAKLSCVIGSISGIIIPISRIAAAVLVVGGLAAIYGLGKVDIF